MEFKFSRKVRRRMNSKSKERIIRTHTDFDDSMPSKRDENLNSAIQRSSFATNIHQSQIHSLLLQSLLEEFCYKHESDPQKKDTLFKSLCEELHQIGFLDESFRLEELRDVRNHFQKKLTHLTKDLQETLSVPEFTHPISPPQHSVSVISSSGSVSLKSSDTKIFNFDLYRYEHDFVELGTVGIGGFGKVYEAWKKGDDCLYAVKKIPFKYSNMKMYIQVAREVRALAKLNHPNVVSYKCSWTEHHQCSETPENSSNDGTPSTSRKENTAIYMSSIGTKSFETNNCQTKDSYIGTVHEKDSFTKLTFAINNVSDSALNLEEKFKNLTCSDYDSGKQTKIFMKTEETESILNEEFISDPSSDRSRHSSGNTSKSFSASEIDSEDNRTDSTDSVTSKALLPMSNPLISLDVQGTMYIQMELCSSNLKDWLNNRNEAILSKKTDTFNCVDEKEVLNIFCQLLKGINHIHSQAIIHRDLTPQNIFFDLQDCQKIKIGDFGLATMCSLINDKCCRPWEECEGHSQGVGTTPYAAPEQRAKKKYDNKVDMYSLGIIFFELLHPFGSCMERSICIGKLKEGKIPDDLSKRWPEYCDIILKLVKNDPHLRPSAADIMETYPHFTKKQIIKQLTNEITDLKATQTEDSKKMKKLIRIKDARYREIRMLRRKNMSLKKKINVLKNEVLEKDEEIYALKQNLFYKLSPSSKANYSIHRSLIAN